MRQLVLSMWRKRERLKAKYKNFEIGQDLDVTIKGTSDVKKVKF